MRASLARLESIQFNAETNACTTAMARNLAVTQVGLDFHWQANNHFYSALAFQSTDGQDSDERRAYDWKLLSTIQRKEPGLGVVQNAAFRFSL